MPIWTCLSYPYIFRPNQHEFGPKIGIGNLFHRRQRFHVDFTSHQRFCWFDLWKRCFLTGTSFAGYFYPFSKITWLPFIVAFAYRINAQANGFFVLSKKVDSIAFFNNKQAALWHEKQHYSKPIIYLKPHLTKLSLVSYFHEFNDFVL